MCKYLNAILYILSKRVCEMKCRNHNQVIHPKWIYWRENAVKSILRCFSTKNSFIKKENLTQSRNIFCWCYETIVNYIFPVLLHILIRKWFHVGNFLVIHSTVFSFSWFAQKSRRFLIFFLISRVFCVSAVSRSDYYFFSLHLSRTLLNIHILMLHIKK